MEDRSRAQHPRRRSLHPIHRLRPRRRRARRGGVQDGGRYRRRPRHCVGDATKEYRSLTVPTDGIQVLATNDARYGKILAGPEYLDWNTSSLVRLLTATGAAANNGTKANAALTADLCGDWREEVIWRAADNTSLRIYSTTIPGRIESTRSCTIRSTVWRSRGRTLVTISRHIRVSISARV